MLQNYTPDFKKNIVRLHFEEGRTLSSLAKEYGVSKAAILIWSNKFNKECQEKATVSSSRINEAEVMKENVKLCKELEVMKKETDFLKNGGILCKGKQLMAYRFVEKHHKTFGVY